jgi:hypothetical protein
MVGKVITQYSIEGTSFARKRMAWPSMPIQDPEVWTPIWAGDAPVAAVKRPLVLMVWATAEEFCIREEAASEAGMPGSTVEPSAMVTTQILRRDIGAIVRD